MSDRSGAKRSNGGKGKRKRELPVGRERTREKRAKRRKYCEAWERASPLTERGHAVERGFYEAACSCFYPHRKPTPTFTLAARPDDSMLKDGRLAGQEVTGCLARPRPTLAKPDGFPSADLASTASIKGASRTNAILLLEEKSQLPRCDCFFPEIAQSRRSLASWCSLS